MVEKRHGVMDIQQRARTAVTGPLGHRNLHCWHLAPSLVPSSQDSHKRRGHVSLTLWGQPWGQLFTEMGMTSRRRDEEYYIYPWQ